MKRLLAALSALPVLTVGTASADEVWTTVIGEVIYESEAGAYAILSFPTEKEGYRGLAFVDGLAGNYDSRFDFTGYWTESGNENTPECDVAITDETGVTTKKWGRLNMYFVDEAFPSQWVAVRGNCHDTPSDMLVGRPVTAE